MQGNDDQTKQRPNENGPYEKRPNKKGVTMKNILVWLFHPPTDGPSSTMYLRVMAGGVFFWEGILKFVYSNQGIGRFTKLGMPFPHFTADFVACLEIGGGVLILTGLLTRLIAIPFIFEMIVAVLSTKISLYLGTSPLPLPAAPPKIGMWAVLHEVRSEYAQLLTVMFLMINGPGRWSLDALLRKDAGLGRRRQEIQVKAFTVSRRTESANASAMV
jgi:putative oxidoreductase